MTLDPAVMAQFTGTQTWYRHGLVRRVLYTEGAKYVADEVGAYWLLDELAMAQLDPEIAREEFQVWKLVVAGNSTAMLFCEDGNDNTVFTKKIEYTDFPVEGITLWYTNNVILLPSEY